MREWEKHLIEDYLNAFVNNFGPIKIAEEDLGSGYYVYYPPETEADGDWIYYAQNIYDLNGWLFGNVQCVHQILPIKKKRGILSEIDRYKV